jgi:hypothetical protein
MIPACGTVIFSTFKLSIPGYQKGEKNPLSKPYSMNLSAKGVPVHVDDIRCIHLSHARGGEIKNQSA